MREIKETCYKGTRILVGNEKREMLNSMIEVLINSNFNEIQIPIIQHQDLFAGKVGVENNNMMYNFKDRGDRDLCLAPEYTAVIQKLAKTSFRNQKDVFLFYVAECFRGEKPQAGRYREFTQLGVEIINPSNPDKSLKFLQEIASKLLDSIDIKDYELNTNVTRGLDYYKNGKGFEISCDSLGSSKQICGGGEYDGGVGFALGIDRILNIKK